MKGKGEPQRTQKVRMRSAPIEEDPFDHLSNLNGATRQFGFAAPAAAVYSGVPLAGMVQK
jgi:hypothetical protein